jgi:hypothetical protein
MLAPPDRPRGRPTDRTASRKSSSHPATGTEASVATPADTVSELAARRCWTWRTVHGCGCGQAADCQLNSPLPFHPDQPCRGMFGDGGKWQPCCRDVA